MKKLLLTLIIGLCLGNSTIAQEPAKTAHRKSNPILPTAKPGNNAAKVEAKEARAKALDAGKAIQVSPAQVPKATEVADKSN